MKRLLLAAVLAALAVPAAAQTRAVNGNALTFECTSDSGRKDIAIAVTNPNGVDKKCDLKCTYTASDKKSYELGCKNVGVFKEARKLKVCSDDHPKAPAPYSNMKAEGKCD